MKMNKKLFFTNTTPEKSKAGENLTAKARQGARRNILCAASCPLRLIQRRVHTFALLAAGLVFAAFTGCDNAAGGGDTEPPPPEPELKKLSDIAWYLSDKDANTQDTPYTLKLSGFDFSNAGIFQGVCAKFGDKYVALDLSDCKGGAIVTSGAGKANIVSLILPKALETVPSPAAGAAGAFEGYTALKSVEFSGAVSIGGRAFKDCANLEVISFPPRITAAADAAPVSAAFAGAFAGCPKLAFVIREGRGNLSSDGKSLVLNGNTLLAAAESAIAESGTDKVYEVPAGIRELASSSLAGLGMTAVKIPATVDTIGAGAFAGCPLTTVEISAKTPPKVFGPGSDASFPDSVTASVTAIRVPAASLADYQTKWTQFGADKFSALPIEGKTD